MPTADSLRADAVFAWSRINKHRVVSAVAILSLGVGIGACTAAFRLIDALFLRPLPIADPQDLYAVVRPPEDKSGDGWEYMRFREMRAAVKDQGDLIAASFPERTDLAFGRGQDFEKAYIQYVSGSMFRSFGLHPALGRLLNENDDRQPGAHPVAVLSYGYWLSRFGRRPNVVGSTVTIQPRYGIGSKIFDVVGVAREGFAGTELGAETDIFVPAASHPLATVPVAAVFRMFVHTPPGIAPESIRDHLDAVLRALNQENSRRFPYRSNERLRVEPAASGKSAMQKDYGQGLAALGVLVLLVLLIVCANVSNLVGAQAAARDREMAVRVSIGAGRARLVQLVLIESGIVACAATVVGGLVAWLATPLIVVRINPPETPARLSLAADWRVGGLVLALTIAVTLLVGLEPALRAAAVSAASAFRGDEHSRPRWRSRYGLIAVQTAFCFVVLFVSGLFAATFERLARQPAGFAMRGLLALDIVTPQDEPPQVWEQVAEHLRSLPAVEKVALSEWALLDGVSYRSSHISIASQSPTEAACRFLTVSPEWLDTMKIPLLQGRLFHAGDTGVTIVNQEFARVYFGGENPIGKSFDVIPGGEWGRGFRIIGVAGDTRYRRVRDPVLPIAYIPYQGSWHVETFMIRMRPSGHTAAVASILRNAVVRARPGFRVTRIRTEDEILRAQTVRERLLATLGAFFGAVALLLTATGLYGVLAYSISQRRREIAIRLAIGAPGRRIAQLVTRRILAMMLMGVLMGGLLSLWSVRYMRSLFYEVSPSDLKMIAFPLLMLGIVGLVAGPPAVLRAVRVDPANVLRAE
jgi:putative ABC transport system permease protein